MAKVSKFKLPKTLKIAVKFHPPGVGSGGRPKISTFATFCFFTSCWRGCKTMLTVYEMSTGSWLVRKE